MGSNLWDIVEMDADLILHQNDDIESPHYLWYGDLLFSQLFWKIIHYSTTYYSFY